ncbi:uncharacterized protein [Haliotis asinina]|uniref:uncharacterized protein n=1 Tax=Haliotis asinina TaxID=109174 RepID=UPI003531BAA8
MAASTYRSIRVRLLFKHFDIDPSWFCVSLKENMNISDVEKRIISKFGLGQNKVELFVSGCRLQSWETSCVLRENDIVHVFLQQTNGKEVHTHASMVNNEQKEQQEKITELEQQCDKSGTPLDDICYIAYKHSDVSALGTDPGQCLQKRKKKILHGLDDTMPNETDFDAVNDGNKEPHIRGEETMEAGELTLPEVPTRKRKRKRKRKNKSNEFQVDQSIKNGTLLEEFSEGPHLSLERIKMTLPHHKQPINKHKTFFEDTIPSDTCLDHSISRHGHGNSDFPQAVCHYAEGTVSPTTTNQKLVERTGTYETLTPKVKETTLNNGVKVFTREKKIPFTHVNKTIISENDASGNCKLGSQTQWNTIGSVASKAADYSQYPDLEAPPHRNDNIAFKMVELAENLCPEISSFKEAEVISYDPITTKVQLQFSSEYQHTCMGETETLNLDAPKSPKSHVGCIVTLDWDSLLEPKLLC